MKRICLILVCLFAAGCDPVQSTGIAIAPAPMGGPDSAVAFTLASRIAQRHGLTEIGYTSAADQAQGWHQCFGIPQSNFSLCGKTVDGEVQFRAFEGLKFRFNPVADTVRRELIDSLRGTFGTKMVRECAWEVAVNPRLSGCPRRR